MIDEKLGRRIAVEHHLAIRGTIGVLEEAALRGLIDLRLAFESLKKTDYRFPHHLLDARLIAFERQNKKD